MDDSFTDLSDLKKEFAQIGSAKENLYDWHGHNEALFFALNGGMGEWHNKAAEYITLIGNYKLFPFYVIALLAIAILSIIVKKASGRAGIKGMMRQWFGVFSVLILAFGAMGITVKTLKNEMSYERPYAKFQNTGKKVVVLERQPGFKATQSFPSGHSAFTAFMATALWPILPLLLRWIAVPLVFAVGWSRVALGVHFPADVVWGLLIGFIATLLVRWIVYAIYRKLFKMHC